MLTQISTYFAFFLVAGTACAYASGHVNVPQMFGAALVISGFALVTITE